MIARDEDARTETLAKLAHSRRQLRALLEGRSGEHWDGPSRADTSEAPAFPRSRTMRMLMSSRGLGAFAAVLCGLLISRPALALRLLRVIPMGAVARALVVRIAASKGR
jgi:hypothetical protein